MFYLSLIGHNLRLPPHLLSLPLADAIKKGLEDVFLDKVIPKLGLCISIYDIREINGGFILAGEGASTYNVEFRMIVFRPFVGEIIVAKLKESNQDGLRSHLLPNPSIPGPDPENSPCFTCMCANYKCGENCNEKCIYQCIWTWDYPQEENEEASDAKYIIDGQDEIKFQVQSVQYPPIPIEQPEKPFAPMLVTGTLDYYSLGPVAWW